MWSYIAGGLKIRSFNTENSHWDQIKWSYNLGHLTQKIAIGTKSSGPIIKSGLKIEGCKIRGPTAAYSLVYPLPNTI